ncbi:hypothetical protein C0993_003634 [Termitomyces sp. T159_Od127]|nr:hypothetical protein C0993_003634 [Termitomyces sp. T159_Od127]
MKSHRPRVSESGPSRPSPVSLGTSLGTSSGKEPSRVVRSSQIPFTPSLGRSESPQPTRLSKQVTGKERSVNTGLPVPRSRSSSGPTKLPSKPRSEVIEISDSTDNDLPPAKSVAKVQFPPKSKTSVSSEATEFITIDDSDEETSSAKPAIMVSKKEIVGPSLTTNYQPGSSFSTTELVADAKLSMPMKNVSDKMMKVDSNASNIPSTSQFTSNGHRCVNRSDLTTPVAAESSTRKPIPAVPSLDLRSQFSRRNGSVLPGSSRIESSKLIIGDTREPRPPVSLPKSPSQAKLPSAASTETRGLDMSRLKHVLNDSVPLSSPSITQSLQPGTSASLPALHSSGRDLRPTLHSSETSAATRSLFQDIKSKEKGWPVTSSPNTKSKASAQISSEPLYIDLTHDSDSDASSPPPPVPRPLPVPRLSHLASDIRRSELLKEIRTKTEPPASPPLPIAPPRRLDTALPKTASPPAAARNNTPIRPMPLPLPTPRLPSRELKKTSPLVSTPAVHDTQPANSLRDKSQTPSSMSRSPIDDTAHTRRSIGSSFGHTSRSASLSNEALPVTVPLPPRTARKSTRGRYNNQGLSLSPRKLVSNSGRTSSIPTSAPLESGSSSPQPSVKSPPKLFNKPEIYKTRFSESMEVVAEDVAQASSTSKMIEQPNRTLADIPREPSTPKASVGAASEPIVTKPFVRSAANQTSTSDNDSELEYVDDPLLKQSFPEPHTETDSNEQMMDVEEFLTAFKQDSPIQLPVAQENTPDPLDLFSSEEDLQVRRSTRSSRSASGEPMKLFLDDDSRSDSPRPSPAPSEDFSIPAPTKTFGGFQSLNWRTYRQDPQNMRLKCYFGKDLPHTLQDTINSFSEAGRRHRSLRAVMEASIRENTAEDEPDAPLIEIINEVDDDPTPPWEFHYSNKMWYGEDVPLPDLTKLVHCNCVGRCDPKVKPCACAERQRDWVDGMFHSPEFLYDSKGHVKATDYPVFECNDLCGCSDECRNRVVQNGRKCAIRIQKTAEKGWGVFAGAKKISAGSFIGLYAGELLTDRVGEMRGITYNKFGRTYLFDLDFWHLKQGKEDWDIQYTVDAYHAGNFTRFLNHSCDPNCSLVSCYINDSDLQKPLLTVFAKRDIEPFEELCFSYSGEDGSDENDGEASRSSPAGDKDAVYVKCACKASNCTGYMFK